jgi:predicted dehydrogenase
MRLGVGIVGLGNRWEGRYLPAIRSLADRFEVRAVCEQVSHRAHRAAAELNAVAADGFRVMAGRDDIDALLYLADQWYGGAPILAACDAGKAIYSAASLPGRREEIDHLLARVEQSGIAFMAELSRRHAPATVRLKELMATRIGLPQMVFCHQRVPHPAGDSRDQAEHARRNLIEMIDWCCYVMNRPPSSVVSVRHATSDQRDASDYQMMSLDFSTGDPPGTGPLAQISSGQYIPASWEEAIGFRPPAALQVACERGIAFIDLPTALVWFDDAGRHQESLESERPVDESMLLQFHRATTSLVRRIGGLGDMVRALRILEAATASQESGHRIPLGDN